MVERSLVPPQFSLDMFNFRSVLSNLPSSFTAVNMRRLRVVRLNFSDFSDLKGDIERTEWSKWGLRHKKGYLWLWNNKQRYVCLSIGCWNKGLFGFTVWKSKTDKNSLCNSSPMSVKSSNVHWQKDTHHLKQPMKRFYPLVQWPSSLIEKYISIHNICQKTWWHKKNNKEV